MSKRCEYLRGNAHEKHLPVSDSNANVNMKNVNPESSVACKRAVRGAKTTTCRKWPNFVHDMMNEYNIDRVGLD